MVYKVNIIIKIIHERSDTEFVSDTSTENKF